ncbi:glycosyltransferase [Aerococcaceae bacterium DSM 111022]|nr:glycosyltransferase [Aerococcaceae bacterium DSM 111022]
MNKVKETYPPMRVLHIMSGFGGGISSFILNKAKEMPDFNITFDVVTYDECSDTFTQAIEATGGQIYQLANPKIEGWSKFKTSFQKALIENKYDLVQCHIDGYRALAYYHLLPSELKKEFYIHAHNSYVKPKSFKKKAEFVLNQQINQKISKSVLGCGVQAIRGVYGENIPITKMMMVPNSIDPDRFALTEEDYQAYRRAFRKEHGYSDSDIVLVQASRYEQAKNHTFTVKFAEWLKEQGLDLNFIFFGRGKLEQDIREEISERNVEEFFSMNDYASNIERVYAGADILFLPSHYEGLPTVVVEAQAAGLPIVMSDSITEEVDLGLGVVKSVSLDAPYTDWYEAVLELAQTESKSLDERMSHLVYNNFTNSASAVLYAQFVRGEREYYQIKEDDQ